MTDRDEDALAEAPLGSYEAGAVFFKEQPAPSVCSVRLWPLRASFTEMADAIAAPPVRPAVGAKPPAQEQYLLRDTQVINVDGSGLQSKHGSVAVHVPPLHDHVITATLNVSASPAALQEAQQHLESVLVDLEARFAPTPAGVGITIAWGLPYFRAVHPKPGQDVGLLRGGDPITRRICRSIWRPPRRRGRPSTRCRTPGRSPATRPHLGSGRSVWNRTTWPCSCAVTRSPTSRQRPTLSSGQGATRRAPCSR